MNDRFKFRAWDVDRLIMEEVHDLYWFEENGARDFDVDYLAGHHANYILMQCTGLRDKNGTLIYEGDQVLLYGKTHVVRWEQSSCGFEPFSDSDDNCHCCGGGVHPKECEIIGNVYESTAG